jgi:hypothetical protein
MESGVVVSVVSIVGAFSIAGFFWWTVTRAQVRARELLHAERQAAIEKGLPPPEGPAPPGGKEPPTHALGAGLLWSFLGLGFMLAMRVVYPGSTCWGWGIILVALGLAYLVGYWLTRGKADADEAGRHATGQ